MTFAANVDAREFAAALGGYLADQERKIEAAALAATDRAGRKMKSDIRQNMAGAGLGRLGNALDVTTDKAKGGPKRLPGGGFAAGAAVYARTRSDRTRGALISYTQGASIRPKRSRYLWIPTDEAQRIAGPRGQRERVTPGNWAKLGLEARIGRLVLIKSINGNPLLAVENATVSATGKPRSARARTKTGRVPKGQRAKSLIIVFIGIRATARAARVDVNQHQRTAQAAVPGLLTSELERVVK